LGPLKFNEVVGVLLYVAAVYQAAGELQDPHGELGIFQNVQSPLGGKLSGIVIVVAKDQFFGVAA